MYDMPTQAWGTPAVQPGPPEPPRKKNRTAVIAIVTAVAVVAAAAVTAVLVINKDDDKKDTAKGDKKPSAAASSSKDTPSQDDGGSDEDNPRANQTVEPVIPGWKTVTNPKRHDAFDVPAGWYVKSPDAMSTFSKDGKPIISMTGPAYYKEDNCTVKDKKTGATLSSPLAGAGTKGAQGAKSQADAAKTEANNWLYAVFDQDDTGDYKYTQLPTKFTNKYGIKGYSASATVTGVKKTDKCSSDGKTFTVTYTDINGDWATWVLYAAKGVKDEVSDETIKKVMSTLRPLKSGT
ncbi:hypothetical protein SBI_08813 [Streptomyces bingchenggensis BCW-1]|uniref:DUF8017 domain-containing protein n=2 Tax=Streptomyces TaxID=1883 RepID=D7BY51_STRBB|nr:hypothetical protein SBI_08813 [Streptomyces bingchenggensis BCW-1]